MSTLEEDQFLTLKSERTCDFSQLYDDQETTDVIFKFKDNDKSVEAHRALLMTDSKYFRNLFISPMKKGHTVENDKLLIYLEEVDPKLFVYLIKYIYSLPVKININDALSLLRLSNRFQTDRLSIDLIKEMFSHLTLSDVFSILDSFETYGNSVIESLVDRLLDCPSKLLQKLTNDIVNELEKKGDFKKNIESYLRRILTDDNLNIATESEIAPIVEHYQKYFNLGSCIRKANHPRNSYKRGTLLTSWVVCINSTTRRHITPIRPLKYIEYKKSLSGTSVRQGEWSARYLCQAGDEQKVLMATNFGIICQNEYYLEDYNPDTHELLGPIGPIGLIGPIGPMGCMGCLGPIGMEGPPLDNIIVLVENVFYRDENENILLLKDCNDRQIVAYTGNDVKGLFLGVISITKYEQIVLKDEYDNTLDIKLRLLNFHVVTDK